MSDSGMSHYPKTPELAIRPDPYLLSEWAERPL